MSFPALEQALWDILEDEAELKYYLWRKDINQWATKPAVIVCTGIGLAPDHKPQEYYTVYFGAGIEHWNAKNLKQARLLAEEFLRKFGKVKKVDRKGRECRLDFQFIKRGEEAR